MTRRSTQDEKASGANGLAGYDVRPGEGVGSLRLGSSRAAVERLLGAAERTEKDDGGDAESDCWHYDSLGLSLHFDGESEFRLDLIDIGSLEVRVLGVRPIGLDVEEARKLFGDRVGFILDTEFPDTGGAVYDLEATQVSLWFQDGYCDSVQVTVPIDGTGEYLWPSR